MQDFHVPLLIAHGTNDNDVPHSHSRTLVDRLLDSVIPTYDESIPLDPEPVIPTPVDMVTRQELRQSIVNKTEVPNFGVIEEFEGRGGKIVYVETKWGRHNDVALQEGVQDAMARLFGLGLYYSKETV